MEWKISQCNENKSTSLVLSALLSMKSSTNSAIYVFAFFYFIIFLELFSKYTFWYKRSSASLVCKSFKMSHNICTFDSHDIDINQLNPNSMIHWPSKPSMFFFCQNWIQIISGFAEGNKEEVVFSCIFGTYLVIMNKVCSVIWVINFSRRSTYPIHFGAIVPPPINNFL